MPGFQPSAESEPAIRLKLNPTETYNMVPGRDPKTVKHPLVFNET
jgi:hypothetical protein